MLVMVTVHTILYSTYQSDVNLSKHDFHALSSLRSWGIDVCGSPMDQEPLKAHGCILRNEDHEGRPVQGVEGYPHCFFFRENFDRAYCATEMLTHDVVRKIIEPQDVVLEIGSRWDFNI